MIPDSDRQREIKLRDIEPGDRVLVEGAGWQTVRDVSGEYVSTEEHPFGHRMDALMRHEKVGVAA
jgi:hypothetical protein